MPLEVGGKVRQVLSRFEAGRAGRRNDDLFAGPGITTDTLLTLLHLEHAEASQFDPFSACQRLLHGIEHLLHRALSLDLRYTGLAGDSIDNIGLDHGANWVR